MWVIIAISIIFFVWFWRQYTADDDTVGDSEICFEASEGGDKASRGGLSSDDVTDEYRRDNEENDEEIDEEKQTDETSDEEVVCKEREPRFSPRQSRLNDKILKCTAERVNKRFPTLLRLLDVSEDVVDRIKSDIPNNVVRQAFSGLSRWKEACEPGEAPTLLNAALYRLSPSSRSRIFPHDEKNHDDTLFSSDWSRLLQPLKATVSLNIGDHLDDLIRALRVPRHIAEAAKHDHVGDRTEQAAAVITYWIRRNSGNAEIFSKLLDRAGLGHLFSAEQNLMATDVDTLRRWYLEFVIRENSFVQCVNVGGEGSFQLPLRQVYVALHVEIGSTRSHSGKQVQRALESYLSKVSASSSKYPEEVTGDQSNFALQRFIEDLPNQRDSLWKSYENNLERDKPAAKVFKDESNGTVVILGDPGSGKTTIVRWLALRHAEAMKNGKENIVLSKSEADVTNCSCQDTATFDMGRAKLPVYARASEFAQYLKIVKTETSAVIQNNHLLSDFLGSKYHWDYELGNGRSLFGKELNCLIKDHLRDGSALVIIDGLDEIPSELSDLTRPRDEVCHHIQAFLDQHGSKSKLPNQIVITSRKAGYSRNLAPFAQCALHAEVRPMEPNAIRVFCRRWMEAAFRSKASVTTKVTDQWTSDKARKASEDLVNTLLNQSNFRIYDLASNPLLLTVLALLFTSDEKVELPRCRAKLFYEATRCLIRNEWRSRDAFACSPFVETSFDPSRLWPLLVNVASFMHNNSTVGSISGARIRMLVSEHFESDKTCESTVGDYRCVEELMKRFEEKLGLIVEKSSDRYGFVHLLFEEFLCGVSLVEQDLQHAVSSIMERRLDYRWKEPISFGISYASFRWPEEKFNQFLERLLTPEGNSNKDVDFSDDQMALLERVLVVVHSLNSLDKKGAVSQRNENFLINDAVFALMTDRLFMVYSSQALDRGSSEFLIDQIELAFRHILAFDQQRFEERLCAYLEMGSEKICMTAIIASRLNVKTPEILSVLSKSLMLDRGDLGWPIHRLLRRSAFPELRKNYVLDPDEVGRLRSKFEDFSEIFHDEIRILEELEDRTCTDRQEALEGVKTEFQKEWDNLRRSLYKPRSEAMTKVLELSSELLSFSNTNKDVSYDLFVFLQWNIMWKTLFDSLEKFLCLDFVGSDSKRGSSKANVPLLNALKEGIAFFRTVIRRYTKFHTSPLFCTDVRVLFTSYGDRIVKAVEEMSTSNNLYNWRNIVEEVVEAATEIVPHSSVCTNLSLLVFPVLHRSVMACCLARRIIIVKATDVSKNDVAQTTAFFEAVGLEQTLTESLVNAIHKTDHCLPKEEREFLISSSIDSFLSNAETLEEFKLENLSNFGVEKSLISKIFEAIERMKNQQNIYLKEKQRLFQDCQKFSECQFRSKTHLSVPLSPLQAHFRKFYRKIVESPRLHRIIVALYGGIENFGMKDLIEGLNVAAFLELLAPARLDQILEMLTLTDVQPLLSLKSFKTQAESCTGYLRSMISLCSGVKPMFSPCCLLTEESDLDSLVLEAISSDDVSSSVHEIVRKFEYDFTRGVAKSLRDSILVIASTGSIRLAISELFEKENTRRKQIFYVLSERLSDLMDPACRSLLWQLQGNDFSKLTRDSLQFLIGLYLDFGGNIDDAFLKSLQKQASLSDVKSLVQEIRLGLSLATDDRWNFLDTEFREICRCSSDESRIEICSAFLGLSSSCFLYWWGRQKPIVVPVFGNLLLELDQCRRYESVYTLDLLRVMTYIGKRFPSLALQVLESLCPENGSFGIKLLWESISIAAKRQSHAKGFTLESAVALLTKFQRIKETDRFSFGQVLIALFDVISSEDFRSGFRNQLSETAAILATECPVKAFQLLWWGLHFCPSMREDFVIDAQKIAMLIPSLPLRSMALARLSIFLCSSKRYEALRLSLEMLMKLKESTVLQKNIFHKCIQTFWVVAPFVEWGIYKQFFEFVNSPKVDFFSCEALSLELLQGKIEDSRETLNVLVLATRIRAILFGGSCCLELAGNEENLWRGLQGSMPNVSVQAYERLKALTKRGYLDLNVPISILVEGLLREKSDQKKVLDLIPYLRCVSCDVFPLIREWKLNKHLSFLSVAENISVSEFVFLLLAEERGLTEIGIKLVKKFLESENDVLRERAESLIGEKSAFLCSLLGKDFLFEAAQIFEESSKRTASFLKRFFSAIHHNDAAFIADVLKAKCFSIIQYLTSVEPEVFARLKKELIYNSSLHLSEMKTIFFALCRACFNKKLDDKLTVVYSDELFTTVTYLISSKRGRYMLRAVVCYRSSPLCILTESEKAISDISDSVEGLTKYKCLAKEVQSRLCTDVLKALEDCCTVSSIEAKVPLFKSEITLYNLFHSAQNTSSYSPKNARLESVLRAVISYQNKNTSFGAHLIEAVGEKSESSDDNLVRFLLVWCSVLLREWAEDAHPYQFPSAGLLCDLLISLSGISKKRPAVMFLECTKLETDFFDQLLKFANLCEHPILRYAVILILSPLGIMSQGLCCLVLSLLKDPGSLRRSEILEEMRYFKTMEKGSLKYLHRQLNSACVLEVSMACCLCAISTKFVCLNWKERRRFLQEMKEASQRFTSSHPVISYWLESKTSSYRLLKTVLLEAIAKMSGTMLDPFHSVPFKLGNAQSDVFTYKDPVASPIRYQFRKEDARWYWTPYQGDSKSAYWMPCSTVYVQKEGEWEGLPPSPENQRLISYLYFYNPSPSHFTVLRRFPFVPSFGQSTI